MCTTCFKHVGGSHLIQCLQKVFTSHDFSAFCCYTLNLKWIKFNFCFVTDLHKIPHNVKVKTCFWNFYKYVENEMQKYLITSATEYGRSFYGFTTVCRVSREVVYGFWWNLVGRLGVRRGWTDWILVNIRIALIKLKKVILHHWATESKTIQHDISKSCGWIQTKLDGHVGCVTRKN